MSQTPGPPPEPQIDADPDLGNEAGGVDAIEEQPNLPPLTREVPRSAQMDDDVIPEEIMEPEGPDREADIDDPSSEPSG
ncbi:MAG TPA: hypothetical protein VFE15_10265 [Marmoricola sp.]|jgi:hypothetical protein|nr:hypothetical protein [Marmoricola sp.]